MVRVCRRMIRAGVFACVFFLSGAQGVSHAGSPEACFGFSPGEKLFMADFFEVTMSCEGTEIHTITFPLQRAVPRDLSHPGFREAVDAWIDEDESKKTLPIDVNVRQWYHALALNKDVKALMDRDLFAADGTWSRLCSVEEQNDPNGRPQWLARLQEGNEKIAIPPCAAEGRPLRIRIKAQCTMKFGQEKSQANATRYADLVRFLYHLAPGSIDQGEIAPYLPADAVRTMCDLLVKQGDLEKYAHEFKITLRPASDLCGPEETRELSFRVPQSDPEQLELQWEQFVRSGYFEFWVGADAPPVGQSEKMWLPGQVLNSRLRSMLTGLKEGDQLISTLQAEALVRLHNELNFANPVSLPSCDRDFRIHIVPVCNLNTIIRKNDGALDERYFALLLAIESHVDNRLSKERRP